jgi:hypothetical protein
VKEEDGLDEFGGLEIFQSGLRRIQKVFVSGPGKLHNVLSVFGP